MPRLFALSIAAALALAAVLAAAAARAQEPAQNPAKDPAKVKRLTMNLDAVLPLLNTAVIRVRTPSEAQVAAGDTTLEAARDGVVTTHLTGIRVSNELAIVAVPDVDPPPASYDVALFDGWLPAPMVATDDARLYALLRISGRREPAPVLSAAPLAPGFVVAAVSVGQTLDIPRVWLEPGEKVALPAGAVVFATDGRFAGLTAAVDGGTIIIPGADVLATAEELAARLKPADAPR
jgi:hypothetical protein